MDQEPMPSGQKGRRPSNSFLQFSGFAFQLLGALAVAGWLGYKLDQYLGLSFPAFMLSFILLMLTGMLYQASRRINREP